jgi:hypothetical protein
VGAEEKLYSFLTSALYGVRRPRFTQGCRADDDDDDDD